MQPESAVGERHDESNEQTQPPGNELHILAVQLDAAGDELQLGIELGLVREVTLYPEMTPVPENCAPFVGIADIRSVPIPVLDLSLMMLNQPLLPSSEQIPRMLVCAVGEQVLGLLVAGTSGIRIAKENAVSPAPLGVREKNGAWCQKVVRFGSSYLYMVELDGLMQDIGILDGDGVAAAA